jgi:hypothetical protein
MLSVTSAPAVCGNINFLIGVQKPPVPSDVIGGIAACERWGGRVKSNAFLAGTVAYEMLSINRRVAISIVRQSKIPELGCAFPLEEDKKNYLFVDYGTE